MLLQLLATLGTGVAALETFTVGSAADLASLSGSTVEGNGQYTNIRTGGPHSTVSDLPCNVRRKEGGQSLVIGRAIPCNIRRKGV